MYNQVEITQAVQNGLQIQAGQTIREKLLQYRQRYKYGTKDSYSYITRKDGRLPEYNTKPSSLEFYILVAGKNHILKNLVCFSIHAPNAKIHISNTSMRHIKGKISLMS